MATTNVSSSVVSSTSLITISQISKLDTVRLPEVSIHGIPWVVKVCKDEREQQPSLAAYLCCTKDGVLNRPYAAVFSFELLSFGDHQNSIKRHSIPYVFAPSEIGVGYGEENLIKWDGLFNENKKFVVDDAIKLKVKIKVEDSNQPNKCFLKFERINSPCDCGYAANFRLTVENVGNLLAVRSYKFKMRGMSFALTVFKDHTSHIGNLLECEIPFENVSCKVTMKAKLVSPNADENPVEKIGTERFENFGEMILPDIVPWNELFNPENGFVNNNAIIFEFKLNELN